MYFYIFVFYYWCKFFHLQNFQFEWFSCKGPWAYGYGAIEILIIIIIIIINWGSFFHSQSIQKENKRPLRTQIMCDVENFKPGRNPVLYRKPHFWKQRVWKQVKGKNSHELLRYVSQEYFQQFLELTGVFSQALLYFLNWKMALVIKSFSRQWQCLFSLGSKMSYTRQKRSFMNQFNIELNSISFTPGFRQIICRFILTNFYTM